MRLNAFLARAGITSRREADELIKSGRVTINGSTGQLNSEVAEDDVVNLDGQLVASQKLRYIMLNKPAGYTTTMKDRHASAKILDLLSIPERVVPVGRLDKNTTGLLLLTNDGQLAHKLMHPSFEKSKTYEVTVSGRITDQILNKLSIGVELEDGMTAQAKARQILPDKIELTIHEGRNRQVRRMMSAVGLKVVNLHRSKYGPLTLGKLPPGQWRELTPEEVVSINST